MRQYLILVLTLSKILVSCVNHDTKILIRNNSNASINQLIVYVQGQQYKVDKIEVDSYSIISVNNNDTKSNEHDFRIESSFRLKDGKMNRGFYYSDLSGVPNTNYTIDIYDSSSVIK